MSRTIKFRAWDKKRKCYAKVIQTTNQGWKGYRDKTYITNGIMRFSKWVLSRFIIEEYTGLTDKNGKEIYEGDIMEFGIAGAENRGVVGYEEDFGSYETYTSKGYIIAPLFTSRGKIIGNIHENPELLGGEE